MLTKEQLAHFRSILTAQLKEFEEEFGENGHFQTGTAPPYDSVGELSSYDNHPADTGTELFEREKDIALNDHAEYEVEKSKRPSKPLRTALTEDAKNAAKRSRLSGLKPFRPRCTAKSTPRTGPFQDTARLKKTC